MALLTGCGNNLYESNKSGYTEVRSVNGVVFDMPSNFLSQATAVTSIAEDVDYSSGTYLYKNGKDMYLRFNINDVVIAIQSGTKFDMKNADDKGNRLDVSSICEVWMSPDTKFAYEDQTKNGVYKLVAEVDGDISVTSSVYAELMGKYATVQYEGIECSVFAGVPFNEDGFTKEQSSILDHIVKSLTIDTDYVDLFVNGEFKESESQEESEDTTEQNPETEKDTQTETTEKEEIPDEPVTPETPADKEEPKEEPEEPKTQASSLDSNQSEAKDGYSDIYHMLKIGQKGILKALNNNGKELTETAITIEKLYTGDDAKNIIKAYCESGASPYKYEEAPAGYSWHVVEYSLEKAPTELYVNIKILGLDGEKLKFRGVAASSRTHDIFYQLAETENGYAKAYCYYAVPNGCKEYMLECGDRITETGGTACYRINNY